MLKSTAIFTDEIVRGSRDSNGCDPGSDDLIDLIARRVFDQESKSDFVEPWNGIQLFFAPYRREFVQERLALFFRATSLKQAVQPGKDRRALLSG